MGGLSPDPESPPPTPKDTLDAIEMIGVRVQYLKIFKSGKSKRASWQKKNWSVAVCTSTEGERRVSHGHRSRDSALSEIRNFYEKQNPLPRIWDAEAREWIDFPF